MRYEIWSLTSGNRLAIFPQIDDAIVWALAIRAGEGDQAVENLSLGDTKGSWVLEGSDLLSVLTDDRLFPRHTSVTGISAGNPIEGALVAA